jgi:hypothetical protein
MNFIKVLHFSAFVDRDHRTKCDRVHWQYRRNGIASLCYAIGFKPNLDLKVYIINASERLADADLKSHNFFLETTVRG